MKRTDLAAGTVGRGRFDLTNPADTDKFIKELATMSIAERHDVLSSRLGSFTNPQD